MKMHITRTLLPVSGKEQIREIKDALGETHYVFSKIRGGIVKPARDFIVGAQKEYADGYYITVHEDKTRTSEAIEVNGKQIVSSKPIVGDLPADIITGIKAIQDYEDLNVDKEIEETDTDYIEYKKTLENVKTYFSL